VQLFSVVKENKALGKEDTSGTAAAPTGDSTRETPSASSADPLTNS
jgi:hypothetical protein